MNIWYLAIIFIGSMEIGANIIKHGEPKTSKWNGGSTFIVWILMFWLMYKAIEAGF